MKAIPLPSVPPLKISKFLLLGIAAGLIAIHLNITWKSGATDFWGITVLFWVAVCFMLWKKRNTLSLKTGFFSSFLGTLLIAWVLLKSIFISGYDPFVRVSPLVSALGLALLASGFQGLKQYWRELLVLCFMPVPAGGLSLLIDISRFTALFSAFVLWYLGFQVSNEGVDITLMTAGVEVYPGCSGMESILHLGRLAVLFLVMFPTNSHQKILVPVVAVFLAFVVNGFRVALMAYLVASEKQKAFEYWHTGDGSLIFSMIAVLIFGLFCLFLLQRNKPENEDSFEF